MSTAQKEDAESPALTLNDAKSPPPSIQPPAIALEFRKKRAVEYMLEGTSVKENKHLARFARAPYLQHILDEPTCDGMMRRQGKALRKELTEAYGLLEAIEAVVGSVRPTCIIDLCSGKGFQSLILAHEFSGKSGSRSNSGESSNCRGGGNGEMAPCNVVMVDKHEAIKTGHVACLPNLQFVHADIFSQCSTPPPHRVPTRPILPIPYITSHSILSHPIPSLPTCAVPAQPTTLYPIQPSPAQPNLARPSPAQPGPPVYCPALPGRGVLCQTHPTPSCLGLAQPNPAQPALPCPPHLIPPTLPPQPALPICRSFEQELSALLPPPGVGVCLMVGVHLCGSLSPRAADLFASLRRNAPLPPPWAACQSPMHLAGGQPVAATL